MVPELFLQETRPVAVTIATIVNWAATFLVGFVFPYILVSKYVKGTTYNYARKYDMVLKPKIPISG